MKGISNARRPAKSVPDRAFGHRPSNATDVPATFARVRHEFEQRTDNHVAASNVVTLARKEEQ